MSRDEEIFNAAQEFCKQERMNTVVDCFTKGARWADDNRTDAVLTKEQIDGISSRIAKMVTDEVTKQLKELLLKPEKKEDAIPHQVVEMPDGTKQMQYVLGEIYSLKDIPEGSTVDYHHPTELYVVGKAETEAFCPIYRRLYFKDKSILVNEDYKVKLIALP